MLKTQKYFSFKFILTTILSVTALSVYLIHEAAGGGFIRDYDFCRKAMRWSENRDTVMLGAGPSLIAEKEHLEYFVESLDKVLTKGLAKVVTHFAAKTLKGMVF